MNLFLEIAKWWGILSGSASALTLLYLLVSGKAAAWRAALIPIWLSLFYLLLWAPLYLIGWILIPIAAALGAYEQNSAGLYEFTWPLMSIYNNSSDGITCQDKNADGSYVWFPTVTSLYGRIWRWSANRNPLASITKIPLVHCTIVPDEVRFIGSLTQLPRTPTPPAPASWAALTQGYNQQLQLWYISWQGLFSSWYWQFNWGGISWLKNPFTGNVIFTPGLYLLWIGSKIKPTDMFGVEAYRTPRTYNTVQFNQQGPLV